MYQPGAEIRYELAVLRAARALALEVVHGQVVRVAGRASRCGVLQDLVIARHVIGEVNGERAPAAFDSRAAVAALRRQICKPCRFRLRFGAPGCSAVGALLIACNFPFHRLLHVADRIFSVALNGVDGECAPSVRFGWGRSHSELILPCRGVL